MYRQSEKFVKRQYLLYMSPQYGELRPLAAEIVSLVRGTPGNFNGFRALATLLHGTLVVGVSQTAALNRGRHLYYCMHFDNKVVVRTDIPMQRVASYTIVAKRLDG